MVDQLNPSSFACPRYAPKLEGVRRVVSGPRSPSSRRCRWGGRARFRRAQAIRATCTTRAGSRGVPLVSLTYLLELHNRTSLGGPLKLPALARPISSPFRTTSSSSSSRGGARAAAATPDATARRRRRRPGGGGGQAAGGDGNSHISRAAALGAHLRRNKAAMAAEAA